MKLAPVICFISLITSASYAQNQNVQAQLTLGRLRTSTSMGLYSSIDEMAPEGKVIGSTFLTTIGGMPRLYLLPMTNA